MAVQTKHANNTQAFLATPVGTSDTIILLQTGQGAQFPPASVVGEIQFYVTVENRTVGLREIMLVTGRTADSLTVVRAQQGTTAKAFASGTSVSNRVTAGFLDGFDARIYDAQDTADAAEAAAAAALVVANDAAEDVAGATAAAAAASSAAAAASSAAAAASSQASSASSAASVAQSTATGAASAAAAAQATADTALSDAADASAASAAAISTANDAQDTANAAVDAANAAADDATAAQDAAAAAQSSADTAQSGVTALAAEVDNLLPNFLTNVDPGDVLQRVGDPSETTVIGLPTIPAAIASFDAMAQAARVVDTMDAQMARFTARELAVVSGDATVVFTSADDNRSLFRVINLDDTTPDVNIIADGLPGDGSCDGLLNYQLVIHVVTTGSDPKTVTIDTPYDSFSTFPEDIDVPDAGRIVLVANIFPDRSIIWAYAGVIETRA